MDPFKVSMVLTAEFYVMRQRRYVKILMGLAQCEHKESHWVWFVNELSVGFIKFSSGHSRLFTE